MKSENRRRKISIALWSLGLAIAIILVALWSWTEIYRIDSLMVIFHGPPLVRIWDIEFAAFWLDVFIFLLSLVLSKGKPILKQSK